MANSEPTDIRQYFIGMGVGAIALNSYLSRMKNKKKKKQTVKAVKYGTLGLVILKYIQDTRD